MSAQKIDVLAVMSHAANDCLGTSNSHRDILAAIALTEARAAVAELIERERKAREALRLAVEKADRVGGDMKYSDFVHAGHPNSECAWYIKAKQALTEGGEA